MMVQEFSVVPGDGLKTDAQDGSLIDDASLDMDDPGSDMNWNTINWEVQVNDLVVKQTEPGLEFCTPLAQIE